jgi:hypothetical protein
MTPYPEFRVPREAGKDKAFPMPRDEVSQLA